MHNTNRLGLLISAISIAALLLLVFLFIYNEQSRQEACALSCGVDDTSQCTMNSCPYKENNLIGFFIWGIGILIAGLGGVGVFLALQKETVLKEKIYDLSGLSDEEKHAFSLIMKSPDGIYQSTLAKDLGISKVQMTRTLDKLGKRQLIDRRRHGMTNIILVKRN